MKWVGESEGDPVGLDAKNRWRRRSRRSDRFCGDRTTFHQGAGKVYVYSSKSGELLHSVEGMGGDRLGNSVVGLGDVDQDGVPDFIAGAPGEAGKGTVRSTRARMRP